MWRNVVWTMDYMCAPTFDCLVPLLWPGNSTEINWVYDTYDHGGTTFADTAGRFYNHLASSPDGVDFTAKPWGLCEFGTCENQCPANADQYFLDAKNAVVATAYPNLKLYQIYADSSNNASPGYPTHYDFDGWGSTTPRSPSAVLSFV
jgi:hypothetical protein